MGVEGATLGSVSARRGDNGARPLAGTIVAFPYHCTGCAGSTGSSNPAARPFTETVISVAVRRVGFEMRLKNSGGPVLDGVRRSLSGNTKHVDAAGWGLDATVGWGQRQHTLLKSHLPVPPQIEAWVFQHTGRYGWVEMPRSQSLAHLEDVLTQTVAAIRQDSERRTRIFVKAVIGKSIGLLAVGGITGLVTSFGVASTGTAIASLSGAAATTAQLYWLGSLIGLGTAAGGLLLAAGGIGAGIAAGVWGHRRLIGKRRTEHELQDHEQAILVACITLINAVKQQIASGQKVSDSDMQMVAEQVLIPLASQINQHWDEAALKHHGKPECRPFTRNLAFLHRWRLDRCRTELGRIAMATMAAEKSA